MEIGGFSAVPVFDYMDYDSIFAKVVFLNKSFYLCPCSFWSNILFGPAFVSKFVELLGGPSYCHTLSPQHDLVPQNHIAIWVKGGF